MVEFSRYELDRRGVDRAGVLTRYEELEFALSIFGPNRERYGASAAEVFAFAADPDAPADDFSLILERLATPRFSSDSRPTRVAGLEISETAGGLSVFQPARNRAHELNDTAALVFDLCTGERSVASIVEVVRNVYELPEPPTTEIEACLDRMRREGVVD